MKLYLPLNAGEEIVVHCWVQTGEPRVRELSGPELLDLLREMGRGVRVGEVAGRVRWESTMGDVWPEPAQEPVLEIDGMPVEELFAQMRDKVAAGAGETEKEEVLERPTLNVQRPTSNDARAPHRGASVIFLTTSNPGGAPL